MRETPLIEVITYFIILLEGKNITNMGTICLGNFITHQRLNVEHPSKFINNNIKHNH